MSPNRFAGIARVEFTVGLTARPRDVNPPALIAASWPSRFAAAVSRVPRRFRNFESGGSTALLPSRPKPRLIRRGLLRAVGFSRCGLPRFFLDQRRSSVCELRMISCWAVISACGRGNGLGWTPPAPPLSRFFRANAVRCGAGSAALDLEVQTLHNGATSSTIGVKNFLIFQCGRWVRLPSISAIFRGLSDRRQLLLPVVLPHSNMLPDRLVDCRGWPPTSKKGSRSRLHMVRANRLGRKAGRGVYRYTKS
jgi:hypothetical protein